MGMFINMASDPELKAMIQRHYSAHVQDYNMKVRYMRDEKGPGEKLNVPDLNPMLMNFTNSPTENFPPITPRTDVTTMNDREISTAYLLTLKRAGREYAWSAMEASEPTLREFLKDAFTMSCNHAYEAWQWMVKKGYYPLEPAPQEELNIMSSIYNEVREPALMQ